VAVSERTVKVQEQMLTALHANQEVVLSSLKPFVPLVEPLARVTYMPSYGEFPTMHEVVERWYDFTIDVLKAQKEFALKVVELFPVIRQRPTTVKPTAKAAA
jgi:hypothetical protein